MIGGSRKNIKTQNTMQRNPRFRSMVMVMVRVLVRAGVGVRVRVRVRRNADKIEGRCWEFKVRV